MQEITDPILRKAFESGVAIDELIQILNHHRNYVEPEHLLSLHAFLRSFGQTPADESTGNVSDLRDEIRKLVAYIKTMRERIEDKGELATSREIKDMIQSSSSLFAMLTKLDDEITNQARLRKVEEATLEAIKTLPATARQVFFDVLEEKLSE